jgi:hypothetical protein
VFLESQSRQDQQQLDEMWGALWGQGHTLATQEFESYRQRYEEARPLRARIHELTPQPRHAKNAVEIIEQDTAELDPSRASTCWIECGRVTAMGRELELKGEQGLFFGLSHLDEEKVFNFRLSNGEDSALRLKYQENAMWRVQMNNDVPEVRAGLRPRLPDGALGRSEFVAVFTRLNRTDYFGLNFLRINSPEFARLKEKSSELGTSSRTRAGVDGRDYGWC